MTANPETVTFLAQRCASMPDDAVKALQGRAIAAAAIHQAGGRFYMAELCEQRAADLLGVLAQRVQA